MQTPAKGQRPPRLQTNRPLARLSWQETFYGLLGPEPEWLSAFLRKLQVKHLAWQWQEPEPRENAASSRELGPEGGAGGVFNDELEIWTP